MSIDELLIVHDEVRSLLSTKIEAEKRELQRRLQRLNALIQQAPKARRPYPKVHPKYFNPQSRSETWSGRGKQPHWIGAQVRSGKKIEELTISQTT